MITENTFAAACFEQNSLDELKSLRDEQPDQADMQAWGLSADEWRAEIEAAIEALEQLTEEI